MSVLKDLARDWLPPILLRWFRQVRGGVILFEGDFATWEEANSHCTGYDAEEILAKVLASTLKVKHGEAAAERDSVLFDHIEYAWPVLAGLMWVAARSSGRLNVLDFGGALGSSYFQNRKFFKSLPDVRWNVVEQPHYVEAGRKFIQDDQLRFYKKLEDCLAENQPNVILLSSVLQYIERPYELLEKLGKINLKHIIVDRTPFVDGEDNKLVIQRVPKWIFPATLPAWQLSENSFECAMNKAGYVCETIMTNHDGWGESFKLKAFLCHRGEL
jgi:putative methyltransferase (TIGR04325 family)